MTNASGEELLDDVMSVKEPRHDTLYCDSSHAHRLRQAASGNVMRSIRTIDKVSGLQIIEIERIEIPIVCQKGDVFTLAEDWKHE